MIQKYNNNKCIITAKRDEMKLIAYKIGTCRKRHDSTLLLTLLCCVPTARCRSVVATVSYYFTIHTHTHTHVSVIIVCIHRQVRDIMVYFYIILLTMGRNGVRFEDQSFTAMLPRIKKKNCNNVTIILLLF